MPNDDVFTVNVEGKICKIVNEPPHFQNSVQIYNEISKEVVVSSVDDVQTLFSFEYSSRILFIHEKLLRSVVLNDIDVDSVTVTEVSQEVAEMIDQGKVNPHLVVQKVVYNLLITGDTEKSVDNNTDRSKDTLGHGLYCHSNGINSGTFIGEYTGIVKECSKVIDVGEYCLLYPSSDGGLEIDAKEFGNIIRFVNHSQNCNAQFRRVKHYGLMHVICVRNIFLTCKKLIKSYYIISTQESIRDIAVGEQITVNYGSTYWKERNINPYDI